MDRLAEVRILGPVEASVGGRPVGLRRPRTLQVLAALALSSGHAVPLERLIALVWDDDPPASARTQVSIHVSALRQAFERAGATSVIETTPVGYRLDDRLVRTDVDEAAHLLESAQAAAEPEQAVEQLRTALALWRGPVLAGTGSPGLRSAVQQWDEARLWAYEELYRHELDLGRGPEMVGALTRLVAENPLRERLRAHLMSALWQSGRRADALTCYQEGRQILVEELGVEPGRELRAAEQLILTAEPQTRHAAVVPAELPADLPSFTGREPQVKRLVHQLTSHDTSPVAAVAGLGGIGKSTLAVHVAHQAAATFPDGQLYIDLRGSTPGSRPLDPHEAQARMLRSLGVADGSIPKDVDEASGRLRSMTNGRRLLIVLDNAADTDQVRPLLTAGPTCRVLVTSRRVLAELPGATHEQLDVFSEAEGVRLMARLVEPEQLDLDAAGEVVRLCGLLPLAIALVAARLVARPSATLADLAARLRQEAGRLDTLRSGGTGLRASFELGYRELGPEHRRMFRLTGLLDGADLAVPVASALADLPSGRTAQLLEDLVDAQLLRATSPGRYVVHDLLRLYARERSEQEDPDRIAALRRALHCHLATARSAVAITQPLGTWRNELEPRTPVHAGVEPADRDEIHAWLDGERDNLLAVVQQAAAMPGDEGPQLTAALCAVYSVLLTARGRVGDAWTLGVIALDAADRTADPRHFAIAHEMIGYGHLQTGDLTAAPSHLQQSREAYRSIGNRSTEAAQVHMLAVVHHRLGRYDDAVRSYREAIALARGSGRERAIPLYLTGLGLTYRHLNRHDDEIRTHLEALEAATAGGVNRRATPILANLAEALRRAGRPDEAIARSREALELRADGAETYLDAEIWWGLGAAHHDRGAEPDAHECRRTSLRILTELGLIDTAERDAIETSDSPVTPEVIRRNL